MLFTKRRSALMSSVAVLAVVAVACGGGSKSSHGSKAPSGAKRGGTLNLLGSGDVDYMDPNISYYTIGYLGLREWTRQLFTYPANPGSQNTNYVTDLATTIPTKSNGGISSDGLTYTIHLKKGVQWNTTPPRDVVAADVVRGVKRTCNPAQPFGGLADYESLIAGLQSFCDAFAKVSNTSATAVSKYLESNNVSGVKVGSDNYTVVFTLTHPAGYFPAMLTLPAFSPAPQEWDKYLPASAQLANNTISDGPYMVQSYNPGKQIVFVRNPVFKASTDDVRHAYADKIVVNETIEAESAQQQLETGSASADAPWDDFPPATRIPQLLASNDSKLNIGPTYSSNPYILFNEMSPNNGGAMKNAAFRQALSYAFNRNDLIRVFGGPKINPPLTQILPPGTVGSKSVPTTYSFDKAKAQSSLAALGLKNIQLKMLYRPARETSKKILALVTQELGAIGIKVQGVAVASSSDFYTKFMEVPDVAKRGVWDLATPGWGPDWYGDAAASWFGPLFDSKSFPPAGSNFGYYVNPQVDQLIQQAEAQTDQSKAADIWNQADAIVTKEAAIYPITDPQQPLYHSVHAHNCVYIPALQGYDPTNIWLDAAGQGG